MEDRTRTFPVQKLPLSKKTEEWRKACVDYCIGAGVMTRNTNFRTSLEEMQSYYDLYNSIFNEKDLKYVTNPFKQDDGFPATAQDHNIIRPKIDLLLGEETKRPFNFHVCRTSDIAAGDIQDKAKKMLMDYIMASILAKMSPEDQQRFQEALESGEIMEPEQIHEYLTKEYKDVAEITAHHTLNYLLKKDNVLHEFFRGWKDYLIAGEEYFYVGILNGEPIVERVNPMEFSYELSSNEQFVHEADNCCRHMVMSANEIYDRLYDKMSEKDLDELLDLINEKPGTFGPDKGPIDDFNSIRTRIFNTFPHTNPFDRNGNIDVWHCCWRSYKKIGFVTVLDEYGNPDTIEVDETYNVTGEELNVEWEWVTEIWEGYRIGDAMYVGMQPLEYQHVSADNPNAQKLPYTGIVASATNSKPKSLVSIMKPLQYWYIMLWYRLELALARDKGKILTMDITQIPKSMGIDVNKWLHYISALGINLINPYECFDPNTKVMMGNGQIKLIKDIQVGETVMGPDGSPRQVLATHSGIDNMYKLSVYTGGEDQIVNSAHKIYYKEKNHFGKKDIEVLSTPLDLIKEDAEIKHKKNLRYLQRSKGILPDYHRNLLIDPYLLGLWLGDGFTRKPAIITADHEIFDYLVGYANVNQMIAAIERTSGEALIVSLVNKFNGRHGKMLKNPLIEGLRYYNVYTSKDIPDDYIYTSTENKLQLLAGLIDTDGHYNKRDRYYTFSQSENRKHIVEKAALIARSLGFKCSINHYTGQEIKQINTNKKLSICQPTWVLNILDGDLEIPVKIQRKIGSIKKTKGDALQSNFKISYNGIGEYCGITVDKDNLFLLSDFTIVHNCEWVEGKDPTKPSVFNQMAAMDASMSNVIGGYIDIMSKIESMVSELTGITPQRQGAISSSELVGNVERSVTQSANITEPLYWDHNQVKRHVLTMLLDTAKSAWQNSNKEKLHYIYDDGTRAFLNISEDFLFEDFDLFVTDSTKDNQTLELMRQQLIQPAMQNGASLLDAAEVLTIDNITKMKAKLAELEQKRAEMEQQRAQQEQEAQQQLVQMQNEVKETELMLREAELDLERYKIDQDNATKIAVAQLNAYRGVEDLDQDNNGIPDVIEIGKQALEEQKMQRDEYTKNKEIQFKKDIEDKKIALEKQKIQAAQKIQKQKDDAAMEREKLKAKTQLQNRVVGED